MLHVIAIPMHSLVRFNGLIPNQGRQTMKKKQTSQFYTICAII